MNEAGCSGCYIMKNILREAVIIIVLAAVIYGLLFFVFQPPEDWPNSRHLPFIKRVIGLPGDTVEIKAGQIFINGNEQALAEPYVKKSFTYSTVLFTVPEDSYYVLGDNRDISEDSHLYGPISRESIIGKAWLSYWPVSLWGTVANYRFAE
jgi:signal peptidase I